MSLWRGNKKFKIFRRFFLGTPLQNMKSVV